jgi:predicted dinucleotide-binding enzyme
LPGRIAIAAAGNDRAAVAAVMQLIDRLGFDAVDAGPLEAGRALEPDGSLFGASYRADELASLVATTGHSRCAVADASATRANHNRLNKLVQN